MEFTPSGELVSMTEQEHAIMLAVSAAFMQAVAEEVVDEQELDTMVRQSVLTSLPWFSFEEESCRDDYNTCLEFVNGLALEASNGEFSEEGL